MNIPSTFTKVSPDYLLPSIKSPVDYYRRQTDSGRYYFEWLPDDTVRSFISVTNLASQLIPMGYEYYAWLMKLGTRAEIVRDKAATFGSAFHSEAMRPFRDGTNSYDFDQLSQVGEDGLTGMQRLLHQEYRIYAEEWLYAFKKNLVCWFQAVSERIERVVAIELTVGDPEIGVASTIDMVADYWFNRKSRLAIIDLKSLLFDPEEKLGVKKSFYKAHEFQLETGKYIWNNTPYYRDNIGEIEHIFNFAPINFRKAPVVERMFKNQTKNTFSKREDGTYPLLTYFQLAKELGVSKAPTRILDIVGKFDSIKDFNYEQHCKELKI